MAHVGEDDLGAVAALIGVGLHADEVDVAFDLVVLDKGDDQRADGGAEGRLELLEHLVEIGVVAVHLADEDGAGLAELCGRLIGLFCADGNAGFAGDDDQGAVRRAEGLGLAKRKVEETGRVEEVDFHVVVLDRDDRKVQRGLSLDLFRVKVGDGGAVRHLAQAVGRAGAVEERLHQTGFAAAAVADDGHISDVACLILSHVISLLNSELGLPAGRNSGPGCASRRAYLLCIKNPCSIFVL